MTKVDRSTREYRRGLFNIVLATLSGVGGGTLLALEMGFGPIGWVVTCFVLWAVVFAYLDVLDTGLDYVRGDHPQRQPLHSHGPWSHAHKFANEYHYHPKGDSSRIVFPNQDPSRIIDLRN